MGIRSGVRYQGRPQGDSVPAHWDQRTERHHYCRGYVEAQKDYAEQFHDDSGLNQFAQRIISTPGKQDGLAWKTQMAVGEVQSERL
jgi:hypothetical protein